MKRGKDYDKITGPMFPRLHVNDTDKGGPRAPPRNKMALYEQLSIPSQRFNPDALSRNPSNSSDSAPPGSSSQGSGLERHFHYPHYVPPPTPTRVAEKHHSHQPDGGNLNTPVALLTQRKKVGEEDFTVPVFVHSGKGQVRLKCRLVLLRKNSILFALLIWVTHRESKMLVIMVVLAPQITGNDTCLQKENSGRLQSNQSEHDDHVPELRSQKEKINISQPGNDSHLRKDCSSPNEPEIDSECFGDKTCGSLQFRNGDRSNDASETSMVDSISTLDISPDDVVGVIGQKQFWKARRAIANQQRVFSVQVFELHRLIKVQRLIAGSPHLLLEDEVHQAKPLVKSSRKNLPSECVVIPPVHVGKRKDISENPNSKMECSAENAIGKTSFYSPKNGQPPNFMPHADPQQIWTIWVIPLTGNFMTSAYGVPTSHYHQGIGFLPGASPVGNACFPPYGMPGMNPAISGSVVEQMNYFAGSGSCGQTAQYPGGILSSNMQHQSSSTELTQKSEAVLQGMKLQASKNTSVVKSPSGRVQGVGTVQSADGSAAPPPFPVTPSPERAPQLQETDQLSKVIKVVPHNGRSATESAARIFQSIQEGRKQYETL
ncbi:protein EARLY FLOWERING [Salix suchowensis]|nr:protein EARLY FLOWERING [Salix suchowensis]